MGGRLWGLPGGSGGGRSGGAGSGGAGVPAALQLAARLLLPSPSALPSPHTPSSPPPPCSLGDENNGLIGVMIIFAVEWIVFMALAWYLEQARR